MARELIDRNLEDKHQSRIHYDLGNAYSNLRQIRATDSGRWWWENEELQQEIYHFRTALDPDGLADISEQEVCRIYTNLGNALSEVGRFVEAIRYWNLALEVDSSFGPAKGQIGIGFYSYAAAHYDKGHAVMLLRAGYEQLSEAAKDNEVFPPMRKQFEAYQKNIEAQFEDNVLVEKLDFEDYSLGDSEEER